MAGRACLDTVRGDRRSVRRRVTPGRGAVGGAGSGPVVPPLPFLELVVAGPMPRKVTLARSWRLSLGGSIIGGLLVDLVCGAGLAIANVASPVVLLPATLGGALFGLLVAKL